MPSRYRHHHPREMGDFDVGYEEDAREWRSASSMSGESARRTHLDPRSSSSCSRRSKKRRRSCHNSEFLYPSSGRQPRPSGEFTLSRETRRLIRRMALSAIVAVGTVCFICAVARWRELQNEHKSTFWTDLFYNQFSCSGVGIVSIIVGLLFV